MDQAIEKIVEAYKGYEQGGWEQKEIVAFGLDCLEILIPEAQQFADLSGPEKKQWVLDTVQTAYFKVDPDIKWVPEPIETQIEKWAIERVCKDVLSPAIDWLVAFMRKKGII